MFAERRHMAILRPGVMGLGSAALLISISGPCFAQQSEAAVAAASFSDAMRTAFPLLAYGFLATLSAWALLTRYASMRNEAVARLRATELEERLSETETLLAAEPHLLFIWKGNDPMPDRLGGSLPDVKGVPEKHEDWVYFPKWLDIASAETLAQGLTTLKKDGTAFNFVVRTRADELLEADGRTAGGLATLRLRRLTGERLEMSQVAQEYRTLEQKAAMLTAILDQAPMPVWVRNHERAITWANRSYLRAVEAREVGDVIDNKLELIDAAQRRRAQQELSAKSVVRQRTHAVMAGERKNVDVIDVAFEGGSAGFAIDMTDLEEAQNELRRHIQSHASTLDKMATAVAIFGADQRIRFYNAAYASLWSLDSEWLNEQPSDSEILDVLREARRLPEQADYRAWKTRQLDAYTRVEPHEDWWHLPDGQTLRVISEQHPFGGVTYLYENVTERIELERGYNELINVQRETLDNLNEGVALFGSDGCLKLYNPAYLDSWRLDGAALGDDTHVDDIIRQCHPLLDDDTHWDEVKYAVTSLGSDRHALTKRISRPDGTVFAFASVPLPDGATLLTYSDITDSSRIERALRERAEALEAADQLKSEFISNVSYELRTPLTNIIGFADGLVMGLAGELNAKQSEYVSDILSSSHVLLRVIDAILDLATIDAGAMELNLEPVDIVETLEAAGGLMRDRIKDRGLTLQIEVPDQPLVVVADESRLTQVLFNLLSNAIGFSPANGKMFMGCRPENGLVRIWVTDMGKGIDPEFRDKLFERFQSRSSGADHRGPGLGLSIVKSFVELHGGRVDVESAPNKGTTMVCWLPINGPETHGDEDDNNVLDERAPEPAALKTQSA